MDGHSIQPNARDGCTCLFFVIWVLAATANSLYKINCQTRLKQRLIERGSSAAEIEQIIRAGDEVEGTAINVPTAPVPVPTRSRV